jgi:Transport and Golgi organisation 2
MCTLTAVRVGESVRLAFNRDELRSRPVALPPRTRDYGQRRATLPLDPVSAGTWIAVNDAGVALALLNINQSNQGMTMSVPQRSRGTIIPALLHCDSVSSTISVARALDASHYAPFRLIISDQQELAELRANEGHIRTVYHTAITDPCFFTSSGLGDHRVEGPRWRLFGEIFAQTDDLAVLQDLFHRHRWPERPHLSVCMSRADARTVSHTIVSLDRDLVTLTYRPDAPDQSAATVTVNLHKVAGGVS